MRGASSVRANAPGCNTQRVPALFSLCACARGRQRGRRAHWASGCLSADPPLDDAHCPMADGLELQLANASFIEMNRPGHQQTLRLRAQTQIEPVFSARRSPFRPSKRLGLTQKKKLLKVESFLQKKKTAPIYAPSQLKQRQQRGPSLYYMFLGSAQTLPQLLSSLQQFTTQDSTLLRTQKLPLCSPLLRGVRPECDPRATLVRQPPQ